MVTTVRFTVMQGLVHQVRAQLIVIERLFNSNQISSSKSRLRTFRLL